MRSLSIAAAAVLVGVLLLVGIDAGADVIQSHTTFRPNPIVAAVAVAVAVLVVGWAAQSLITRRLAQRPPARAKD